MRGTLRTFRNEPVTLTVTTESAANSLGETLLTYTPGQTVQANVQPLGSEQAEAAGLVADRELLRVQLPPLPVTPGDHLIVRALERNVVRSESWQSYTVCICEPA